MAAARKEIDLTDEPDEESINIPDMRTDYATNGNLVDAGDGLDQVDPDADTIPYGMEEEQERKEVMEEMEDPAEIERQMSPIGSLIREQNNLAEQLFVSTTIRKLYYYFRCWCGAIKLKFDSPNLCYTVGCSHVHPPTGAF